VHALLLAEYWCMLCCRIGMNALSNEFLTNACNQWRERLSEGGFSFSVRLYDINCGGNGGYIFM